MTHQVRLSIVAFLVALYSVLTSSSAVQAQGENPSTPAANTVAPEVETSPPPHVSPCGGLIQTTQSGGVPWEWEIPEGRCFVDLSRGSALPSSQSYALSNAGGIALWDEYRRLGGADRLGRPLSDRFQLDDGFVYQLTERGLLQWRPELTHATLANSLEILERHGDDAWLYDHRQIPYPIMDDGAGTDWARARTIRLAWLTDPVIEAFYHANPTPTQRDEWSEDDAITLYGLPMSHPEDFGPFTAQRFQRAVIQRWKGDGDQVTLVRLGELFRQRVIDPATMPAGAGAPPTSIAPSEAVVPEAATAPSEAVVPEAATAPPVIVAPDASSASEAQADALRTPNVLALVLASGGVLCLVAVWLMRVHESRRVLEIVLALSVLMALSSTASADDNKRKGSQSSNAPVTVKADTKANEKSSKSPAVKVEVKAPEVKAPAPKAPKVQAPAVKAPETQGPVAKSEAKAPEAKAPAKRADVAPQESKKHRDSVPTVTAQAKTDPKDSQGTTAAAPAKVNAASSETGSTSSPSSSTTAKTATTISTKESQDEKTSATASGAPPVPPGDGASAGAAVKDGRPSTKKRNDKDRSEDSEKKKPAEPDRTVQDTDGPPAPPPPIAPDTDGTTASPPPIEPESARITAAPVTAPPAIVAPPPQTVARPSGRSNPDTGNTDRKATSEHREEDGPDQTRAAPIPVIESSAPSVVPPLPPIPPTPPCGESSDGPACGPSDTGRPPLNDADIAQIHAALDPLGSRGTPTATVPVMADALPSPPDSGLGQWLRASQVRAPSQDGGPSPVHRPRPLSPAGVTPAHRFLGVADFPIIAPGSCGRAFQYWGPLEVMARTYGADPELLAALLVVEGSGERAVSPAGAMGLMQLMPDKFRPGDNPFDIGTNFQRAAQHIAVLQAAYGSSDRVAAAYFGAIDRAGNITGASDGNVNGFEYVRGFQGALHCIRAGLGLPGTAPTALRSPLGNAITPGHISFGFLDHYGAGLAAAIRGPRDLQQYGTQHLAWDLVLPGVANNGRGAPVYAPIDGRVIRTTDPAGGPFGIWIEHALRDLRVRLMHMDGLAPGIVTGAEVQPGQWLGILGGQGTESFPHLHLSIERRSTGERLDPAQFFFGSVQPATGSVPTIAPPDARTLCQRARLPVPVGPMLQEWEIPDGQCFADGAMGQASGAYALTNAAGLTFWDDYRQLGGTERLGRPLSDRFQLDDGLTYQLTERALLQWRPELGHAVLANGLEILEQHGDDPWLHDHKQIPYPIVDDGAGSDWTTARTVRLAWLTDPVIGAFYRANPDPAPLQGWSDDDAVALYGLPMSEPEDFGPFTAQRFQRAVIQRWTTEPQRDQITVLRVGEMFRERVLGEPVPEAVEPGDVSAPDGPLSAAPGAHAGVAAARSGTENGSGLPSPARSDASAYRSGAEMDDVNGNGRTPGSRPLDQARREDQDR